MKKYGCEVLELMPDSKLSDNKVDITFLYTKLHKSICIKTSGML